MPFLFRRALAAVLLGVPLLASAAAPEPASFEGVVSAFARDSHFSGVVLVADDGKPVYRRAFGLANQEWQQPNTVDTR